MIDISWHLVLIAAAGGAFGASIGALPAFAICGFLVVLGELVGIAEATGTVQLFEGLNITADIGFGAVFGPHVAFAGGVAALAYAAAFRDVEFEDWDFHPAKEIKVGLGSAPPVLAIGGCFGAAAYIFTEVSIQLGLPLDPVAFGVVASAIAHRLAFGYDVVGSPEGGWFDMEPFEQGEKRSDDEDRPAVEPWLPFQYRWPDVATLGIVAGVLGGFLAWYTGSAFLGFGLSAASLAFLTAGVAQIPVTHHMTIPASAAVLAFAGVSGGHVADPTAVQESVGAFAMIGIGAVFGLLGALFAEVIQRIFYAHGDTHFDPPAASIVLTSIVIAGLWFLGIFEGVSYVPTP